MKRKLCNLKKLSFLLLRTSGETTIRSLLFADWRFQYKGLSFHLSFLPQHLKLPNKSGKIIPCPLFSSFWFCRIDRDSDLTGTYLCLDWFVWKGMIHQQREQFPNCQLQLTRPSCYDRRTNTATTRPKYLVCPPLGALVLLPTHENKISRFLWFQWFQDLPNVAT